MYDAVIVGMWEQGTAFHISTMREEAFLYKVYGKKSKSMDAQGVNFICEKGVKSVDNLHWRRQRRKRLPKAKLWGNSSIS